MRNHADERTGIAGVTTRHNAEFRASGQLVISEVPLRRARHTRRAAELRVAGRLIHAGNGYGLAGLTVKMCVALPAEGEEAGHGEPTSGRETLLGGTTSGPGGHFSIAFGETEFVRQQLCLLRQCAESTYCLRVEAAAGREVHVSAPLKGGSFPFLTLKVSIPSVRVGRKTWVELSQRLAEARMAQVHNVVAQLVSLPSTLSIVGDWALELRHSILTELEQAFIDPDAVLRAYGPLPTLSSLQKPKAFAAYAQTVLAKASGQRAAKAPSRAARLADSGESQSQQVEAALSTLEAKAQSFSDLSDVDWVFDINELPKANRGITKYQDQYSPADGTSVPPSPPPQFESAPELSKYRNYLRAIYTGAPQAADYAQWRQKLETRFHQSFAVQNAIEQPVNQILKPIVKAILTAPAGAGCGFGMDSADIPAQGQQSDRAYLDELIGLTGLSARELGLRYRIDLKRPDRATTNRVAENIATLQAFYRDWFHAASDPPGSNILGIPPIRFAPFYLQYDEWLAHDKPSFPENTYDIAAELTSGVAPEAKEKARGKNGWMAALVDLEDLLYDAQSYFSLGEYASAMAVYDEAADLSYQALDLYVQRKDWVDFDKLDFAQNTALIPLEESYAVDGFYDPFDTWFADHRWQLQLRLVYLIAYILPACRGDAAFAMGDYPAAAMHYAGASRFRVGRASTDSGPYSKSWETTVHAANMVFRPIHLEGNLPYTFDPETFPAPIPLTTNEGEDPLWRLFASISINQLSCSDLAADLRTPILKRFFKLRHGNALLEWADALYRTDEPASIARARELYKAVMHLHGATLPISPSWSSQPTPEFIQHSPNPALRSQEARALRGFTQIELALNYYGLRRDFVPALRYRPLKDAADRFAATARAAQQDFLTYMGNVEAAMREGLATANMLRKAALQREIAEEQEKVAGYNIAAAEQQVKQVEAAIAAKKAEIDDHDDGWAVLGDFIGGFVDAVGNVPGKVTDSGGGFVSAAYEGTEAAAGGAATTGLAATAGPLAAIGIYVYAGIASIQSMNDAHDRRLAELIALRDTLLPLAEANLEARQTEAKIVNLQRQIAQADAELAVELIRFQADRMLNIEFWISLVKVTKRTMRRYLELGARFAWLAERALAYEQDQETKLVRFDYFPAKLQGVTGADLLQLDLAELEVARLARIKSTVPIKHTYSMMADFPLQLAKLRKQGHCAFQTTELPFRYAYPGTYGYRIIAVSVAAKGVTTAAPVRGLLRNHGISSTTRADGQPHLSIRFPDALPLSEFWLREDRAVYSLPDEALMSFEGSGVDTFWELTFPSYANPYGLAQVADIQLTFDVRASYSASLYEEHVKTAPKSADRFLFFSALKHSPAGLAALRDTGPNAPASVGIAFDLTQTVLPSREANRVVKNLVIALASEEPPTLPATFGLDGANGVTVTFEQGTVLSNAPPWTDPQQPLPPAVLNQLIGESLDQKWVLTIDKSLSPLTDFSLITDVILGFEYSANLL